MGKGGQRIAQKRTSSPSRITRISGNQSRLTRILGLLANQCHAAGDYDEALKFGLEALAITRARKDVGGEKFVSKWVTYGTNLARAKPYTVSVPSNTQWGAGDPDGTRLTDGIVGPPYPGGTAPSSALCWNKGQQPEITVDLGVPQKCGAFRIQLGAGWP